MYVECFQLPPEIGHHAEGGLPVCERGEVLRYKQGHEGALGRVAHIFKSCLFFFSKLLIPLYFIRTDTTKKFRSIGGGLGVHQALANIRPKYKGNDHKIGHTFLLTISFYGMQ